MVNGIDEKIFCGNEKIFCDNFSITVSIFVRLRHRLCGKSKLRITKSSHWRSSVRKLFLKISQNLQKSRFQ